MDEEEEDNLVSKRGTRSTMVDPGVCFVDPGAKQTQTQTHTDTNTHRHTHTDTDTHKHEFAQRTRVKFASFSGWLVCLFVHAEQRETPKRGGDRVK